jgi:3-hydroxybutyryl-CoA dehydrogenase
MELNTIGVLGAGVMGCDLTLDLALHNYKIILYDISKVQLDSARNKIEQQFRLYKMMNSDTEQTIEDIFNGINSTPELGYMKEVDFIVENIVENWDEKKKLYLQLNDIINDTTVVASNTSCIPISKIAALMKYPGNIIGTHFMNPVPFKKFVEVIKGKETSEDTLNKTLSILKTLGKKSVVVNDAPGFVSNRVLMMTINESIRTVEEEIAKPADVDKIFKLGFSHSMGPLATADLIGLDTIMYSLNVLYEEFKNPMYMPCKLLIKMVEAGTLGKKSGKGFFNY